VFTSHARNSHPPGFFEAFQERLYHAPFQRERRLLVHASNCRVPSPSLDSSFRRERFYQMSWPPGLVSHVSVAPQSLVFFTFQRAIGQEPSTFIPLTQNSSVRGVRPPFFEHLALLLHSGVVRVTHFILFPFFVIFRSDTSNRPRIYDLTRASPPLIFVSPTNPQRVMFF